MTFPLSLGNIRKDQGFWLNHFSQNPKCFSLSGEGRIRKGGECLLDILYLVVPCYNEEAALPETAHQLRQKLETLITKKTVSQKSRILFVDDGSKDGTWKLIIQLHQECLLFEGLKLSRNRGHQNALLAGLMTAKDRANIVISMDADLQDDIHILDHFLEKYKEGYDVVYGVRSSRETDHFFKRATAQGFYRVLGMMGIEAVYNHADYRLMSQRALMGLAKFGEVNLFLRGMVPLVGYQSTTVEYSRGKRLAGKSKYPFSKMLNFALDGITSLSIKPIRLITLLGFLIFGTSLVMLVYALIQYFTGYTVAGWASLAISVWAIGGLQLLAIGVIGEYLGKIYLETKARPRYIIEEFLENQ